LTPPTTLISKVKPYTRNAPQKTNDPPGKILEKQSDNHPLADYSTNVTDNPFLANHAKTPLVMPSDMGQNFGLKKRQTS
jgi:hypothetical protein